MVNLAKWKKRNRVIKARKQTLATKVNKLTRMVKKSRPEIKWSQYIAGATSFTGWSGFIMSPLSGISQGAADFNNRIGDTLRLRNMKVCLQLDPNSSVTTTNFRVIAVQCKNNPDQVIGIASQLNLILHSTSVGTINAVNAPYDHDNRASYRVLKDFTVVCNPIPGAGNSATMSSVNRLVKFNIPFKSASSVVEYSAATSAITKNELFIIVLSQLNATNYVSYDVQTYYTDA